jgi:Zn-dependent peptidase ImmA (M78 family)/transcriptional regulator with XRE-family HTH domain
MHFGERIRQAREIRGWTQEQLASEINKSKSLIAQAEAGFRVPSSDIIESVALATKLPLAFFNEAPHPEFPLSEVLFRAPRSIKRRQVIDAVRYAEHIFSIYTGVAQRLRDIPCRIPEINAHPADAARSLKVALGLKPDSPMTNLIRPLERAGVSFIVLPSMEMGEAFSVWINQAENNRQFPVIAYTVDKGSVDRTRLSLAHELGHLTMHRSFLRKAHAEIEDEAFGFAAEWLMPEAAMRSVIQDPVTLTSLAKLKPIWGVSVASLVRRAFNLSLITLRQYHYLFQQIGNLGWKMREPEALDIPIEKPRLFRKMVELVYGKPINFVALASDTHVTTQELRRILAGYEESAGEEPGLKSNILRFSK